MSIERPDELEKNNLAAVLKKIIMAGLVAAGSDKAVGHSDYESELVDTIIADMRYGRYADYLYSACKDGMCPDCDGAGVFDHPDNPAEDVPCKTCRDIIRMYEGD